ncbi:MAG: Xaa-Pro peptidase family protein [Gammaproteobacteria bacterium]|nr:Xaa-Pro peptidase family protein [Gammaproteobacteria bacterium]
MSTHRPPARGFPVAEFESRVQAAQRMMHEQTIDVLLLTTEPEFRYFSGFHSDFWLSPTRPWYLLVPLQGQPIAIIPEIGASSMRATWIEDIRTWPSPVPQDDGISLLKTALSAVVPRFGSIGIPMGPETHLRMPLCDFQRLRDELTGKQFVDATSVVRTLRMVKSEAEIEKLRHVCGCVSAAFAAFPQLAVAGATEAELFRVFRTELLRCGVDKSPYLVGAAGAGGYADIIKQPSDVEVAAGDVLIFDTGSVFDGYFSDFDRNFCFGVPASEAARAYDVLYRATEAGLAAVRPGVTTSDLWRAMAEVLDEGGSLGDQVGRFGHGLGMQLTEWPSNMPGDDTVLQAGMVITLEPGMVFGDGKLMVHEEDVVVREDGYELLSQRAAPELVVIG